MEAHVDLKSALTIALARSEFKTSKAFAEASGIPVRTLSSWMNEGNSPSLNNLQKIAGTLNIKVSTLLSYGEF
jgi:transcriptional regulator with XRE-family HTH domain